MDISACGFVNGGGMQAWKLRSCLAGWAGEYGAFQTPYQTITYLSCHDDWTLWDKLVSTMDEKKNYNGSGKEILRANRLAAAINFCCQGRPFFLSGEEFGRTKGGIKNSYCSRSEINQLDWQRAWKNQSLVDYYRGLIALRMRLPGVQDKSRDAAKRILWVEQIAADCVMACVDNQGAGSGWEKLLMIFNCADADCGAALPAGSWQLLADGENSFRWQEKTMCDGNVNVARFSALILGSK